MNYKTFLSDQFFLSGIRLYLLGCISNGFTALVFLATIWGLSDSLAAFLNALESETQRAISTIIYLTVIWNLGFLLLSGIIRYYFFSLPANLEELKAVRGEGAESFAKYTISFFMFIAAAGVFLIGLLSGESWDSALRLSLLAVFPFPVAFVTTFLVSMIMETILLTLSYIIHHNHQ